MAITLTQTDTAATCSNPTACAVNKEATISVKQATAGGTAGTTAVSVTRGTNATDREIIFFQSAAGEPNSTSWESGTWTVRIEITTSNMNVTSWSTGACALDTACSANLQVFGNGPATGDFTTTGVKTSSRSGNAITAGPSDTIVVVIAAGGGTMGDTFGYKPSQNIDTPVEQGLPLVTARGMDVREQNAAMFPGLF